MTQTQNKFGILNKSIVYLCIVNQTRNKMTTSITHAEQKLQQLKHACINCHPSMKAYYQEQYYQQTLHIKQLKGE